MGDQMRRVWRAFSEIGEADYKGYRTVTWLRGRVFGYDAAYDPCFFGFFFLRARRGSNTRDGVVCSQGADVPRLLRRHPYRPRHHVRSTRDLGYGRQGHEGELPSMDHLSWRRRPMRVRWAAPPPLQKAPRKCVSRGSSKGTKRKPLKRKGSNRWGLPRCLVSFEVLCFFGVLCSQELCRLGALRGRRGPDIPVHRMQASRV